MTLAGVGLALSIGGTILGAVQQSQSVSAQGKIAQQQADFKTRQLSLQVERERSQRALEAVEREKNLSKALSAQRARFAGVAELSSGTPLTLAQSAISEATREQRLADFANQQRIANINVEQEQVGIGLTSTQQALKAKRGGIFIDAVSGIGTTLIGNRDLFKNDGNAT